MAEPEGVDFVLAQEAWSNQVIERSAARCKAYVRSPPPAGDRGAADRNSHFTRTPLSPAQRAGG